MSSNDVVQILPIELISKILKYLTPIEIYLLQNTSKTWKSVFTQNVVYYEVLQRLKLPMAVLKRLGVAMDSFLYLSKNPYLLEMPIIFTAVEASSTDHISQSISMTRSSSDFSFWSSSGTADITGTGFLTYKLYSTDCLVKTIVIKPFLAQFQRSLPCYAPVNVQFQIGKDEDNLTYTSPVYHMVNKPTIQTFELPEMIKGGFVKINLIGYYEAQPGDRLYYHAIEMVDVLGIWGAAIEFDDLRLALVECNRVREYELEIAQDWIKEKQIQSNVIKMLKKGDSRLALTEYLNLGRRFRDADFLEKICSLDTEYFQTMCFQELKKRGDFLSEAEALQLARTSRSNPQNFECLQSMWESRFITPTLELGLEFEKGEGMQQFALHVYQTGRVMDKCIEIYIQIKRFRDAAHCILISYPIDEIAAFIRNLYDKFGKRMIAKVLVNLLLMMNFDGIQGDMQGLLNQIANLMDVSVNSRRILLTELGEIADGIPVIQEDDF